MTSAPSDIRGWWGCSPPTLMLKNCVFFTAENKVIQNYQWKWVWCNYFTMLAIVWWPIKCKYLSNYLFKKFVLTLFIGKIDRKVAELGKFVLLIVCKKTFRTWWCQYFTIGLSGFCYAYIICKILGNEKIYIYLRNTTLWALKLCRVKSLSQMCN